MNMKKSNCIEKRIVNNEWEGVVSSLLKKTESVYVDIGGDSMLPVILKGDKVEIKLIGTEEIGEKDIVLCKSPNRSVALHRIIKISQDKDGKDLYLLKGDFLRYPDGWISQEDIYAKVVSIKRRFIILRYLRYLKALVLRIANDLPNCFKRT